MRYLSVSRPRRQTCARVSLILLLGVARAHAQTSAAPAKDEPVQLSPFDVNATADHGYRASNSVSATRIDAPLDELPITINAFTQDFIEDQKARSLWEVVRFAPGVTNSNPEFNGGSAVYNIRGFNTATTLRNGFAGPTVLETVNIARVEVVKGPGSLLYGNIEPGGVINYITKRPEDKLKLQLEETIGTDGYWRSTADLTGPVGGSDSPVLFRVVGAYDHAPEYYDPSKAITKFINPSLTWKIGSKTRINFDYEKYKLEETPPVMGPQPYVINGIYAGPAPGVPWFFNAASYADFRTSDSTFYTVDATTEIGGWNLRAAYSRDEQQIDALNTAGLFGTDPASRTIIRRGRFQRNAWIDNTYQVEATHKFDFGEVGNLSILFGYQRGDRVDSGRQDALPGAKAPPPWDLNNPSTWNRTVNWTLADLTVHNSNYAIDSDRDGYYAVGTFNTLNNKLHLLGGVRRSWADSLTTDVPTGTTSGYFSQNKTTPQGGILFELTPEFSLYGSYSESYQPQGGSLITKGVPGKSKVPLTGKGTDAGIKYSFDGGRVSGALSVFHVEYDGLVREFTDGVDENGNVLITQEQSGADESKGVEFDILWALNEQWQVLGTYAYVDPTHKVNSDPTLVGKQTSDTVKSTANVWIKYVFPQGALRGLSLAGGGNYVGPRLAMDTSTYRFKEVYSVDFLASYAWGRDKVRYSVDLSLKNILNEHYFLSTASRGDPFRSSVSFTLKL